MAKRSRMPGEGCRNLSARVGFGVTRGARAPAGSPVPLAYSAAGPPAMGPDARRRERIVTPDMTVVPQRKVRAAAAAAVLMAIALAAPSGASAFQKGFWGPATVNGKSQFPIYKDLGVTLYQMAVSWPSA